MLVYARNPHGVIYLGRFRIWGKQTGREPIDIPFELYNKCKDGLADGTYREGHLRQMFGKEFPMVAFTYREMKFMPESKINEIGPLIVDDFDVNWSFKKKIDQIKIALVSKSPCQ